MIYNIVIPALGVTGEDVVLEQWLVQPGQFVKTGTPLFVITTEKATVDVEAFHDGYLRQALVEPGTSVPVGALVGRMADTLEETLEEAPTHTPAQEAEQGSVATPAAVPVAGALPRRKLSSPLARRLAQESGLDIALIPPSGSQGQVLKRDVLKAFAASQPVTGVRRVPLSSMRKAIALRTQKSNTEIPHFYGKITVDMTDARQLLKQVSAAAEKEGKSAPTITDLILVATARALRSVPGLNVSFHGDEILEYEDINLGLIIGLPDGLIVPVIHRADRLDLHALAETTRRLRQGAEAGALHDADLTGGTFTVSNLGMYGLDAFSGVINPPEAGILALGAARQQPAAFQGTLTLRWLMEATLSADHRAVDGITVAKFLAEFKRLLEDPRSLIETGSKEK